VKGTLAPRDRTVLFDCLDMFKVVVAISMSDFEHASTPIFLNRSAFYPYSTGRRHGAAYFKFKHSITLVDNMMKMGV
jgi:hypothetical protein